MTLLDHIQQHLESEKFECVFLKGSETLPVDCVVVSLPSDLRNRSRSLEIRAFPLHENNEKTRADYQFISQIHFKALLPFSVEELALNQVASLILFINNFIDLIGFELHELENQIYYRYSLVTNTETTFDPAIIMTVIGSILMNLELFSNMIENLARGKMTFNELLSSSLTAFQKNK